VRLEQWLRARGISAVPHLKEQNRYVLQDDQLPYEEKIEEVAKKLHELMKKVTGNP
jgi:hypothetical protein